MKCSTVRDELSRYVEGALSGGAQAAIARHLAACPACRAEAEAYQRAEEALRSLAAVLPAPDLTADLRRRLSAAAPPRPLRWVWAGAALAAVATAAALLALRAPAPRTPPQTIVRQPVAAGTQPQQLVVEPVTEKSDVLRPTTPPPPSPATLHHSPQPPVRVDRVRHDAPPQPAQEVALETTGAEAAAVARPETRAPSPEPSPTPDGIVLLIAAPQPPQPSSSYYCEVTLPDGATSTYQQTVEQAGPGEAQSVKIVYQQTPPPAGAGNGG